MFFTRLGYIVASLVLIWGIWNVIGGLIIATEFVGPYETALRRYFPSATSSGQVIDRGLVTILIGVALGTLTEISKALRARDTTKSGE